MPRTTARDLAHEDAQTSTSSTTSDQEDDTPTDDVDPTDPATPVSLTPTTSVDPTTPEVTTTTICVDSFDPGCGTFRWSGRGAPNQPMTATIELLTDNPVAGKHFEVLIRATDPDATPIVLSAWITPAGIDPELGPGNCYKHGTEEGFGPWRPPAPKPGSAELIDLKRANQPGTYWITGCISSTSWETPAGNDGDHRWTHWCPGDGSNLAFEGSICRDPFGSFATPRIQIEVGPAP